MMAFRRDGHGHSTRARWRRVPLLFQRDGAECGTTCLAMILGAMGVPPRLRALRILASVNARGVDMAGLLSAIRQLGLEGRGLRLNSADYENLPMPCIAHVNGDHFVVLERIRGDVIDVLDPGSGHQKVTRSELSRRTTGAYLYCEPGSRASVVAALNEAVPEDARRMRALWATFLRPLLLPLRRNAGWVFGCSAALQVIGLAAPLAAQRLVDTALSTEPAAGDSLRLWLAALALAQVIQLLLTASRDVGLRRLQRQWGLTAGRRIFDHIIRLPPRVLESYRREDLMAAIETREAYAQLVGVGFVQSTFDLVQMVVYAALLLHYAQVVAVGVLLSLLAGGFLLSHRMVSLRVARRRQLHAVARAAGNAADTLDGITIVKLACAEELRSAQWDGRLRILLDSGIALDRQNSALQLEQTGIGFLAQLLVFFVGASLVHGKGLSPGQFVAMITVVTVLIARTQSVVHLWTTIADVRTASERLHDLLLQPPESVPEAVAIPTLPTDAELRLREVSYRYDGAHSPALDRVTLDFPPRGRVAIVGRNGSGKSTLIKVISGLYRDHDGVMSIGEVSAGAMSSRDWRRQVGVVPQDAYLFEGSIRDNLLLLRPDASEAELWDAVRDADLMDYVQSSRLGLDMRVTAGGSNMSGGQRLRIAIGRLFLADPRIVLLDEASSALDPIAEHVLLDNVNRRYSDRLIVSAAHRLNTVASADWLIMMERGRVIGQGTHPELLRSVPQYAELVNAFRGIGIEGVDPGRTR